MFIGYEEVCGEKVPVWELSEEISNLDALVKECVECVSKSLGGVR